MTVLASGGSTVDVTRDQMQSMLIDAQADLGALEPPRVSVSRVLYHPEAIMLGVEPHDRLLVVADAVRAATAANSPGTLVDETDNWVPHVTVLYSTTEQEAAPLVAAAGRRVRTRDVSVDTVSLVIQWGPEKSWDWEIVGSVKLGTKS